MCTAPFTKLGWACNLNRFMWKYNIGQISYSILIFEVGFQKRGATIFQNAILFRLNQQFAHCATVNNIPISLFKEYVYPTLVNGMKVNQRVNYPCERIEKYIRKMETYSDSNFRNRVVNFSTQPAKFT